MDTRASVSIVPPAGSQPTRAKSLRQQRASNGANIIKAYVLESEQRREQAKFHATAARSVVATPRPGSSDDRCEQEAHVALSPRSLLAANQVNTEDAHALDALFAERRMHRSRRPSIVAAPARSGSAVHGATTAYEPQSNNSNSSAIKPIMRKRLQMEMISSTASTFTAATSVGKDAVAYRSTPSTLVPHHPRVKHNLGAKLDALIKSSAWNRRKVVITSDDKTHRSKVASPRHAQHSPGTTSPHDAAQAHSTAKEPTETEIEMRVMTAFRQIVRLWRERKRRAEAAAVSIMNGNGNGIATGTGRNGSKLRKDLMAQSGNVVGILSRRLIREVPALKFFDDEVDPAATMTATAAALSSTKATLALPSGALAGTASASKQERAKPRGVCYTLDAFGCRKIKMQSSTVTTTATAQQRSASNRQPSGKTEELTLEKAMTRSLRRKMARRIKTRRLSIARLSDDFSKSRRDLAMKLRTQLALQRAEIEKMFNKRLTLLMTEDTSLPPYMARKELHLARLRCKKAHLLEKCETLRVLALALRIVEAAGEASGVEVTTGELHFLDLFRCVVEENQVLTPIISNAIRQHMRCQDLQQPMIMDLFALLERHHSGQ